MKRRRLYISLALVGGFVVLVLGGLAGMVKREPSWYAAADLPEGDGREELSRLLVTQVSNLSSAFDDPSVELTADQINAFFQEDYQDWGGDENLPDDFYDPRVMIVDGKMRIGARYGKGLTSTILTLEVKVWKVDGAMNTLAMEIVSLKAGNLPLSKGFLLDYISQGARQQNIDVTWFRNEGNPVAILRFQADQPRPTFQFESVELRPGVLKITTRSTEQVAPPPRVVSK